MYIHMYLCICIFIYVSMFVCIFPCIYSYAYMNTCILIVITPLINRIPHPEHLAIMDVYGIQSLQVFEEAIRYSRNECQSVFAGVMHKNTF